MKVLVFDTETNGLIPRKYSSNDKMPYILQLAGILYDTESNTILDTINDYVNISEDIEIPEQVTKVNNITKELLNEKGKNIMDVMNTFYNLLEKCDILIGHNVDFDVKMIKLEFQRNGKIMSDKMLQKMYRYYCTMKCGTAVCQIESENKYGKFFKYPKLEELYFHLFREYPSDLHNAIHDVIACLQCYMNMEHEKVIENNIFTSLQVV